jgi:hypothetical protein
MFSVGDRGRISEAYHWAQGATGTIVEPPWPNPPAGQNFREVPSPEGLLRFYWVEFDEPHEDDERDGYRYSSGEIDERYLVAMSAV